MDKFVTNRVIADSLGWTFVALSWRIAGALRNFSYVVAAT